MHTEFSFQALINIDLTEKQLYNFSGFWHKFSFQISRKNHRLLMKRTTLLGLLALLPLFTAQGDSLLENSETFDNGWRYSPWLGYYYPVTENWLYHLDHEWLWLDCEDETKVWIWNSELDWIWTSRDVYPVLYLAADEAWTSYIPGSSHPRLFHDWESSTRETLTSIRWKRRIDQFSDGYPTDREYQKIFVDSVSGSLDSSAVTYVTSVAPPYTPPSTPPSSPPPSAPPSTRPPGAPEPGPQPTPYPSPNPIHTGEEYIEYAENPFLTTEDYPLSTLSIDVDTASYSNLRRQLDYYLPRRPDPASVRIEELINYFDYDYPEPDPGSETPFAFHVEMASCPWEEDNGLLRIGLQARSIPRDQLPPSNFVFLLDVSGSMGSPLKLPLLKQGFRRFVAEGLREDDRVAIVTYASRSGVRLESTTGSEKKAIMDVIDSLGAGGSTAGAAGIQMAYQIAEEHFIGGGNNRVILATDGDFNVGVSSVEELDALIAAKRESNVFLTVLGFGTGNIKDNRMQTLAEKGNGNYHYIDSEKEAEKVLLHGLGNLFTIAKNVKIQIAFDPEWVRAYRLIGYESRLLNPEDFDNDLVDSGDLGAGHTVTTFYEIEWTETPAFSESAPVAEMKSRYMFPEGDESRLDTQPVAPVYHPAGENSVDFQFAAAVAMWGQIMRTSRYAETMSLTAIIQLALAGKGDDAQGYRGEFIELVTAYQHFE